jgi:UDP-glucuronate decarboxylase
VVSNFIVQALQGHPITIYGDGKQTRSFCYVGDLVRAIYSVLMLPESLDSPVNIGNPTEFTMIELANLIIELTNSKSQIVFEDLPQDDPKQRKPNIDSVYSIVNWSPQVNLRNGIMETISYFKDLLSV